MLDLFNMLCTGTAVAEFNGILFKATGKIPSSSQADFNENICLADEISDEVKAWKEKTKIASCRGKVIQ